MGARTRRDIARWQTWWLRLFVVAIVAGAVLDVPAAADLLVAAVAFTLYLVRPPASEAAPTAVRAPVRGRWTALNSPGSAVPSHGVKAYGQAYAVDLLVPVDGAPAPPLGWSLSGRAPTSYAAFGEPALALSAGRVVEVKDSARDHRAASTWPLVLWMMTFGGFLRELRGASGLLGNHVVVEHGDGTWSAYAHLRQGSATVRPGDVVQAGQQLGEIGNTGNSSEPHLHVQLMDRARLTQAAGVPMLWLGVEIDPEEREQRWATGEPKPSALPDFPQNGDVFVAP